MLIEHLIKFLWILHKYFIKIELLKKLELCLFWVDLVQEKELNVIEWLNNMDFNIYLLVNYLELKRKKNLLNLQISKN